MNCQCNSVNYAEIATAISTLFAVVVALLGQDIRRLWAGPKLCLKLYNNKGELTRTNDGKEVIYYHLVARNEKRDVVSNVLVFLTQVDEKWEGGKRNLWTGEVPMHWMFAEMYPYFTRTIGAEQRCDIISVNEAGLTILARIIPNNLQIEWKTKCDLYLSLIAKGDQTVSKPLTIHVVWDGIWVAQPEEMKKHLSIESVNK